MKRLQKGYMAFARKADPAFYRELPAKAAPHTMFITCAEGLVAPETLFDACPGELFVYRNLGALVVPGDLSVEAAIVYGIEHLKVENLFVLVHSGCGVLDLAGCGDDLPPPLRAWLEDEGRCGASAEETVREHGIRQVERLKMHPLVRAGQVTRGLRVMLLYFDVATRNLEVYEHGEWEPFLETDA